MTLQRNEALKTTLAKAGQVVPIKAKLTSASYSAFFQLNLLNQSKPSCQSVQPAMLCLLEGVAQQEADLAAGVALLAFALIAFGPVKLRLDLPNAGDLLLILAMEIRAGELVSHGLGSEITQGVRNMREMHEK